MEDKKERAIDRIKMFVEWLIENKVVKSELAFERTCGLSNHYIKNLLSSRGGNVGCDTVAAIYDKFPAMNIKWVVTGKGGMFGTKNAEKMIEQMRLDMIAAEVIEAGEGDDEKVRDALKRVLKDHKNVLSAEDKIKLLERLLS